MDTNPATTESPFRAVFRSMTAEQRAEVARVTGHSVKHLQNVSYGDRSLQPSVAAATERVLAGAVTVEELYPDPPDGVWVRTPERGYPHPKGRPALSFRDVQQAA